MATRFFKISSNGNKILKSKLMTAPSYKIIFNFSFPFSIVRLHFAYEMNLTELSETGRIKYVNSEGQLVLINSHERLTGIDYGWFAQKAMDRQLYHTAIDFVKEGIRLHETKDEGIRRMHPQQFEMMQKFKKDLVKLNNG